MKSLFRSPIRSASCALLAAALCTAAVPSWSLERPRPSVKDQRVRTADYDPADIIQVDTAMGVATHIVLADDEEYLTHAFGDSAAYSFVQESRHLLLKPKADQADTNLIYITNKRSYAFLLKYAKVRTGREFFRLELQYPDAELARASARSDTDLVRSELSSNALAINWEHYTMNGDMSLAPVSAWDDGAQTWLRFAPGQDLPVVYFVDADGQEVIANRNMADEHTIVLHRVAKKWHLRLGNQVLAVHNEGGVQARSLPTRTISPAVERVTREEPGK